MNPKTPKPQNPKTPIVLDRIVFKINNINMSEDFQIKLALEETIRAKSDQLYKLKNSITSKLLFIHTQNLCSTHYLYLRINEYPKS